MKKVLGCFLLGLFVAVGISSRPSLAQESKEKKTATQGEARWTGTIVRSNADTSTLTVRKGHVERIIHYDSTTKWTKGTQGAEMKDFTDGSRVICLGKYNEKKEFVATRIDLRAPASGRFP